MDVTGEFKNAIDEKGRISFPAKLRGQIEGSRFYLTKGFERCLWLFPPDEWDRVSTSIRSGTSLLDTKARMIQRRIIGPAQLVEIDKSGRISVPQTLREYAGLSNQTIILGIGHYIEIWSEETYEKYLAETDEMLVDAGQSLGEHIKI